MDNTTIYLFSFFVYLRQCEVVTVTTSFSSWHQKVPFLQLLIPTSSISLMAAWDLVTYLLALCVPNANRKTLELSKDEDVVVL